MKKSFLHTLLCLFFILCMCLVKQSYSQGKLKNKLKSSISIIDSSGLSLANGTYGNIINGQSFQQDALTSANGWQYITYYDAGRHVCVGRRKLPSSKWEIVRLTDYRFSKNKSQENDAHNTISMGLCQKDGTIHLSFDQHGGGLNYRVSRTGILEHPEKVKWESTLFNPVINYLEKDKPILAISYPAFISTPQGNLLFIFRNGYSGNGDCILVSYDGSKSKWYNSRTFISGKGIYVDPQAGASKARNAYLNNICFDRVGRLHISWTWREIVASVGNRDICYAYSTDNGDSWLDQKNVRITAPTSAPTTASIDTETPNILVKRLDRGWGMINQQSQVIDHNLTPHIVMSHRKEEGLPGWSKMDDALYFHYYKMGDNWIAQQIPFIGNRPKLLADKNNNLYLIFIRKGNFDFINQGAPLVIVKAKSKNNWADWTSVYESNEHYFNEVQLDVKRWTADNVLSIMGQTLPINVGAASVIKVIDIKL